MSSTNKTTNYELSQYIGTDKPTYLGDYNSDMLKIDTRMKANQTATETNATAIGTVSGTATTALEKATANETAISGVSSTATSALNKANSNETDITALKKYNNVVLPETLIGTYKGLPLYRKIVEHTINAPVGSSTGHQNFDIEVFNTTKYVHDVYKMEGMIHMVNPSDSSDCYNRRMPIFNTDGTFSMALDGLNETGSVTNARCGLYKRQWTNSWYNTYPTFIITIEYTKNADID